MIEIVKTTGQANPPKVPYSPRPLEQATGQAHRGPAPAPSPDYVRVLGSPAQNSRTPGSLRPGQWHVRWESPLSSAPSAVLVSGARVLVQRSGGWTLFDRDGKHIAGGTAGSAVITIDPRAGAFYSLGSGNTLQAVGLEQGDLRFMIPLGYDERFAWPMFHRSGKRIVVAGVELPMMSPQNRPPVLSLFQAIEVGSPLKLSPYKVLLSIDVQQDLQFKEPNMMPVASGDILWAVMPDLLIRTSPAQNIDGAFSGSFKPVSASADEAGWLHVVVETGDTAHRVRELWIVTPEGRRPVRVTLPPGYGESKAPPAIGYDRRVYLRGSQSIAAFSPEGVLAWESQAGASIAGMSVTPDGHVVLAAGTGIFVFDASGKAAPIAGLAAPATTSPVVTSEGEILVGTQSGVICLAAH